MGPFPHDAPLAEISADNPAGTDGFEFVEFAHPQPEVLAALFQQMGFERVARHKLRPIDLYRQGDVNYILNADGDSFGGRFVDLHGPCAPAMAWRVVDAAHAFAHAVASGGKPHAGAGGAKTLDIPAIEGIGGSVIYLVDRYGDRSIYDVDFVPLPGVDPNPAGAGLAVIDHLTHNVHRGRMDVWAGFYERLFNFRQIRYFDIEGKLTGIKSRAMTSPDGKIRIPINESGGVPGRTDQIEEYLQAYHGEGIQHIALATRDIYRTVEALRTKGVAFLDTPETYYSLVDKRLPGHREDLARLQRDKILIDGGEDRLLLQIFTETVIGPVFYEIIQRKGDEGFGEGNFKALFESIELDQMQRGVLRA